MFKKLSQAEAHHLFHRAGFGLPLSELQEKVGLQRQDAVADLFKTSRKIQMLQHFPPSPRKGNVKMKDLPPEEKKAIRKKRRQGLRDLNLVWMAKMASDKAQLREKMTFFWHDHFAAHVKHPYGMQDFNNLMRRHAIGNFKALLTEVCKHPVMLEYLNAKQNRKASPNENFARELMELFTLGPGHYTEKDIKEAARAFTGWNYNQEGDFVFRKKQHDFGQKSFRGASGTFVGEDILKLILQDERTAYFICEKLYRFLVHPVPNPDRVAAMAQVFFRSDYDISKTLEYVLLSDWFYAAENHGVRIKSPVEYLVMLNRQTGMTVSNGKPLIQVQKILGQVLFHPPNVAGWPEGNQWIDSSTLSTRMLLPAALLMGGPANFKAKPGLMDSVEDVQSMRKLTKLEAKADWPGLLRFSTQVAEIKWPGFLAGWLLPIDSKHINLDWLENRLDNSDQESHLRSLFTQLMTLPEYQLC